MIKLFNLLMACLIGIPFAILLELFLVLPVQILKSACSILDAPRRVLALAYKKIYCPEADKAVDEILRKLYGTRS